jgi:hypothetical protein
MAVSKYISVYVLLFSCLQWYSCCGAQDDWKKSSFPIEERTSGIEVGPEETRWGRYVKVNVKTSKREFADTTGAIYITFYGKRATSDTLLLQKGFNSGSLDSVRLLLNREIGVSCYWQILL